MYIHAINHVTLGSGQGPSDTRDVLLSPSNVALTEMDTAVFVCIPADPSFHIMWSSDIPNTLTGPNSYFLYITDVGRPGTVSCTVNGNIYSSLLTIQGKLSLYCMLLCTVLVKQ